MQAERKNLIRAHVALFTVNVIYGATYVAAKAVMSVNLPAKTFVWFRLIGATALMWLVYAFNKEKVDRSDIPRIMLCGLFGTCINMTLFFEGLSRTSSVNGSIIMMLTPIIVLLISLFIVREKMTPLRIIGIFLGAAGAILMFVMGGSGTSGSSPLGDLLVLLNGTSYAIYLVIVKPLMSKYKPVTVLSWVFLFGLIFTTPLGLMDIGKTSWDELETTHWVMVGFVTLFTTFVAYFLNIFSLKYVSPVVTSSYIYLQPVLTLAFSSLFFALGWTAFAEGITWNKAGFIGLIVLGVYLTGKRRKS